MTDLARTLKIFWDEVHTPLYKEITALQDDIFNYLETTNKKILSVYSTEQSSLNGLCKNDTVRFMLDCILRGNHGGAAIYSKNILNGSDKDFPPALKDKVKLFEFDKVGEPFGEARYLYENYIEKIKPLFENLKNSIEDFQYESITLESRSDKRITYAQAFENYPASIQEIIGKQHVVTPFKTEKMSHTFEEYKTKVTDYIDRFKDLNVANLSTLQRKFFDR